MLAMGWVFVIAVTGRNISVLSVLAVIVAARLEAWIDKVVNAIHK